MSHTTEASPPMMRASYSAHQPMISSRQRGFLETMCRSRTAEQRQVERAKIVLMSTKGLSDRAIGKELGVGRRRVGRWRRRWMQAESELTQAELAGARDSDLRVLIENVLADRPRSGAPARFTAEQITCLIALACESPGDSGLPVSHWTPAALASEAVTRGIVESISPRHLDRFLKRSGSPSPQEPLLAQLAG